MAGLKKLNLEGLPDCPDGFEAALWVAKEEERDIENVRIRGVILSGADLEQVGFYRVLFENCRFLGCSFGHGAFREARFANCDLSNCDFGWAYFKNCEMADVKAMGMKAQNANFMGMSMERCNLSYANLGDARFENWMAAGCDFSESFLTACVLKQVTFRENRLARTSFFGTPLRGMDFTSCQMEEVLVSEDGAELAGAKVDVYQAAEFAKLFGLLVKY